MIYKRIERLVRRLACAAMIGLTAMPAAAYADVGFLVDQQLGQATGSSCQSYSIGVAMAFQRDPGFPITNYAQLREFEQQIRAKILELAKGKDPTHQNLIDAVKAVTGGAYRLVRKQVDFDQLIELIGARTGVTDASLLPPAFLMGQPVTGVVLSSATKIGGSGYKSGHIFSIFGRSGPPNSSMRFLVLNSGVKVGDDATSPRQNVCAEGLPDQPSNYWGSLSWRNDIAWKTFGNGEYVLFWLEKAR